MVFCDHALILSLPFFDSQHALLDLAESTNGPAADEAAATTAGTASSLHAPTDSPQPASTRNPLPSSPSQFSHRRPPQTRAQWAQLARSVGVKGVHVSERDTQRAAVPRRAGEFVNTWCASSPAIVSAWFESSSLRGHKTLKIEFVSPQYTFHLYPCLFLFSCGLSHAFLARKNVASVFLILRIPHHSYRSLENRFFVYLLPGRSKASFTRALSSRPSSVGAPTNGGARTMRKSTKVYVAICCRFFNRCSAINQNIWTAALISPISVLGCTVLNVNDSSRAVGCRAAIFLNQPGVKTVRHLFDDFSVASCSR